MNWFKKLWSKFKKEKKKTFSELDPKDCIYIRYSTIKSKGWVIRNEFDMLTYYDLEDEEIYYVNIKEYKHCFAMPFIGKILSTYENSDVQN